MGAVHALKAIPAPPAIDLAELHLEAMCETLRKAGADPLWEALRRLAVELGRHRHGREVKAIVLEFHDGETARLPVPIDN